MKKITIIFSLSLVLCGSSTIMGQQNEQTTLSLVDNLFMLNPAEGGAERFTDFKLAYRNQWLQHEGAPVTYYISGHHPINNNPHVQPDASIVDLPHHGVGGFVMRDMTGVIARTSISGSYSYHVPLTPKLTVALGAFIGVKNYNIDNDALIWHNGNGLGVEDGIIQRLSKGSLWLPDASAGIWVYEKMWYFGAATYQLIPSQLKYSEENDVDNELKMHHFVTAGAKIHISEESHFYVVPSLSYKGIQNSKDQIDLNIKVRYDLKYWGAVSYRHEDAIALMGGVLIKNQYELAYAYDWNIVASSDRRQTNNGTHEIMLGYRLHYEDEIPPAQFW